MSGTSIEVPVEEGKPQLISIELLPSNFLARRAQALLIRSQVLTIDSNEAWTVAVEERKETNTAKNEIANFFKPMKQAADQAHGRICAEEQSILNLVKQALEVQDGKIIKWKKEQDALAEAERVRLEAQARTQEEDRKLAEAQQLSDAGEHGAAEAVLAEPVMVAPVYVPPSTPKVVGLALPETWHAKITNLQLLCKHVGETGETQLVMKIDENKEGILTSPGLNSLAKALKATMKIPGVQAYSKTGVSSR